MVTEHLRTQTSEGYIPHYPYRGLHLPVKIEIDQITGSPVLDKHGLPRPLRKRDRLVYVFPGGGELVR